jgi:hypothetical protein
MIIIEVTFIFILVNWYIRLLLLIRQFILMPVRINKYSYMDLRQ